MRDMRLLIECGASQTRATLIENERPTRLWFGPARGDEQLNPVPQPGRRFIGKVLILDKRLDAAFVEIGHELHGFLPLRNQTPPTEGALICVVVKRAPRGKKGATLALSEGEADGAIIGPVSEPRDAVLQAYDALGVNAAEIIIDIGATKALLEQAVRPGVRVTHDHGAGGLFASYHIDAAVNDAFSRNVTLPGGGSITIDEAEALTAIDVDAGGTAAASGARLNARINIEAARVAADQLCLRNIGGQIAIDFLPVSGRMRHNLNDSLKPLFPEIQHAGWTKTGLFVFSKPRAAQSLLEQATEPAAAAPVAGRRFTDDWVAKSAITQLEERLKTAPSGKARLVAGAAIGDYLRRRPQWENRLQERYGARFEILAGEQMEEREFDVSE